jgi:hypothetical protein
MFAKALTLKFQGQPRDTKGRFSQGWQKVSYNLGSNAGGIHVLGNDKFYVKYPKNPDQIHAEVASDKVHELLGCKTIGHTAKSIKGKLASVTAWNDNLKPLGRAGWEDLDNRQKQQAASLFMASALTKNWDLVGLSYDNIAKDKKGDLHIVDTGGSFNFRAMGEHKDFDADANKEVDTFLNPEKTSGRVFKPLMQSNPEMFRNAARKLKTLTREDFEKTLSTTDMKDQKQIVDTLMQRRDVLIQRFKV